MYIVGIIETDNNRIRMENILKIINKKDMFNINIMNDSNIENFKNIKFNVLIINDDISKFLRKEKLKEILENTKILILNIDYVENRRIINEKYDMEVITYGFSKKATVTIISFDEGNIILELQRKIIGLNNNVIEEKEIKERYDNGKKRYALFYKFKNFGKFIVII